MPETIRRTDRQILFNLIAGFVLCDHMGDVAEDCIEALVQAGILTRIHGRSDLRDQDGNEHPYASLTVEALSKFLSEHHGATTLFGASLSD